MENAIVDSVFVHQDGLVELANAPSVRTPACPRMARSVMTCPTKCIEYKPCVMCQQWGTGPYDEERCAECPFKVIPVEELPGLLAS
ncbi:integrin beta tail domain protein [Ancylostoma duodenale]|uniref:Integrin beta tail domain protein n=1 Tax=Ancylostoma duodenale TaxID=51022 RepID=A0A0C2FLG4_9BILA|nr:integrin beta tail domain protein [Ancylostoma duodenale]